MAPIAIGLGIGLTFGGSSGGGLFGYNGSNLNTWKAAVAAVRAGSADTRLVCWGDSTVAGVGSTNSYTTGNAYSGGWPVQLSALMPLAKNNSFAYDQRATLYGATLTQFDSRRTLVGAGAAGESIDSLAGRWICPNGSGGGFDFAVAYSVDTFDIIYSAFSAGGNSNGASWALNGGAATNFGTPGFVMRTEVASGALAPSTLNIRGTIGGAGEGYFYGVVIGRNSAVKEVSLINAGFSGATAALLADGSVFASPKTVFQLVAPKLTILEAGAVNDMIAGTSRAAFETSLAELVTAAKVSGNVILLTPIPISPSSATKAIQQEFVDRFYNVSVSAGVPLLDIWTQLGGDYDASLMDTSTTASSNLVHPGPAGYELIALSIKQALASVGALAA